MEVFFKTPDGISGFITGVKSPCDHDSDGEPIISFHNSDEMMLQKDYQALPDEEKEKLNTSGGSSTCSKCGEAWWNIHNPYYL